jgi:ATP/maltotriose-dependent transcriptional regulator MalT
MTRRPAGGAAAEQPAAYTNRARASTGRPLSDHHPRLALASEAPDADSQHESHGMLKGPAPGAAAPGLAEPLTGRELEVLRLIAAGRSSRRIARDLVVALDTVKSTSRTCWASSAPKSDRGRRADPPARPYPLTPPSSRAGSTFG